MYVIPAEREAPVQEMFSSIARSYDLNNTLLSFGMHYLWKQQTVREARLSYGGRSADLCAGTCDIAALMARQMGPDGHVDALDLNAEMLEVGRFKLAREELSERVTITRGNAEQLPFKSSAYDAVTVGFGIRNVVNRQDAFAEMARILKPGGRAVCLEFSRPANPVWRSLYEFYNFTLLPKIGTLIAKDKTAVYEYLPASIKAMPDQQALADIMRNAGFSRVSYTNLCGGIVALHVGVK